MLNAAVLMLKGLEDQKEMQARKERERVEQEGECLIQSETRRVTVIT